jgi:ribosomal protein S18 acetylase RimI-like enzyme
VIASEVRFGHATVEDAGEILTLQLAAFVREARLYDDAHLPPLEESLESIETAIRTSVVLVGRLRWRMVAAGRVTVRDGVGDVGRLAVAPDLRGQGIGRRLLAELEAASGPEVSAFELFTGEHSDANLHLYRSAGYRDVRAEPVESGVSLLHLRKERNEVMADAAADATPLTPDDLIGSWRLELWRSEAEDGSVAQPFGERPEGILVYDRDGTMITTIAPADRPRLSSADPLQGGPDEERRRVAESVFAYSGTWALSGDDVVHTVVMSLYPNWVGTRQVRHVRLLEAGARLELSTDPFLFDGLRSVQRLLWRRGP